MKYIPKSVLLEINNICNFNCRHCYAEANSDKIELSFSTVQNILKQLANIGVNNIAFSGGEPLLHSDLFKMIECAKIYKFNVIIDTNGSLISQEKAHILKQLGVDLINISLHGYYDYEHEYLTREKGSFEQVLNVLEILLENELNSGLNIALNPMNYQNAHKILLIAVSYNVSSVSFFRIFQTGRAKAEKDLMLNLEAHKKVFSNIKGMIERMGHPNIELYTELPYIYRKMEAERLYACGIGMESFIISNKGEIYLCNALRSPELVCGSIYDSKISEIWNDSEVFNQIREIRSNPKRIIGICSSCNYYNICIGGCRACSYNIYGDFIHSDEKCWLQEKINF